MSPPSDPAPEPAAAADPAAGGPPPEMSGPPIFVVGCHRSGTTLFRLILDSHPHISCGPETRFLADLEKITDDDNWPRMGLYGFSKDYWHQQVAALFNDFQSRYATAAARPAGPTRRRSTPATWTTSTRCSPTRCSSTSSATGATWPGPTATRGGT